jgi:two-component system KDP operon response regulator KdpE
VILDLGLPDLDGVEVTRRMREWTQIPIIILSVREREIDKIAALDAGADDYLTKPFGTGELMARIRASIRRSINQDHEPVIEIHHLKIDLARRRVALANQDIALTPTEYDILRLMAQNSGKVITHHQLLQQVWGQSYGEDLHLLRVNISNLRRKIEPDPTRPYYILTEAGVGYRLRSEI